MFKDYFSKQADIYARSRPKYPDELFSFLSSQCSKQELAWDCATGNGQAAVSLARFFKKVVATDASSRQIDHAVPAENVTYYVASAYESKLDESSADLITVATAAHWFDLDRFYTEAGRVLGRNGVIALWGYTRSLIIPEIDQVTGRFAYEILKDYWPEQFKLVDSRYKGLSFPFPEIVAPQFYCLENWNLYQLCDYLLSWSSTQNYITRHNRNPVELILPDLERCWGDPAALREVRWEIYMRVGKKS
jgi:ubiquinone/menaquinone biosynthesis C-methylase UbiE